MSTDIYDHRTTTTTTTYKKGTVQGRITLVLYYTPGGIA